MRHTEYDVIVVGLGATGGSALYHLAKSGMGERGMGERGMGERGMRERGMRERGMRVLGIDQFAPPHNRGSSHGHTRIYRQAYYEAPAYVPLALRALELWHELERDTRQTLFSKTGVLTIGKADSEIVTGALKSAQEHGIAHELLSFGETSRRFPAYVPSTDAIGLFEPTGGVLFADLCVEAHLTLARAAGASVHTGEAVTSIDWSDNNRTVVHTASANYSARKVIVAAGAWAPKLLGLEHAFRVTRETVHWFDTRNPAASAPTCPVSLIAMDNGKMFYSIPNFGDGFKAGLHHTGLEADANVVLSDVDADERAEVAAAVAKHAPAGAGPVRESAHCYYTSTVDFHFAMGTLPWAENVTLAAACSGHGFKFATALGEALAQSIRCEPNLLPADVFNVARLGASSLAP